MKAGIRYWIKSGGLRGSGSPSALRIEIAMRGILMFSELVISVMVSTASMWMLADFLSLISGSDLNRSIHFGLIWGQATRAT
jgi:hypothetical protein